MLAIAVQAGGAGALSAWNGIFGTPRAFQNIQANIPRMVLGGILTAVWCGLAIGVLAAWKRGILGATGVILSLSAITTLDLMRVDFSYIQVAPYSQFFPDDPTIEAVRSQLGPGERVVPFTGTLPGGGPDGGYLATYRIPEVFGYHSNQLRWYDQLTRREERERGDPRQYWESFVRSPALSALATRVAILPTALNVPGLKSLGSNGQITVYRDTTALSAVTVVPGIRVEPDSVRRLELLWDPTFNVSKEVLVDAPVGSLGPGGGTGTARLVDNGADSLAIEATTSGPSMLLLSRTFHPSWKAAIDGAPTTVLRVNHALIGVPLEKAGTHSISLSYRPAIVAEAKLVTTFSWIIVIVATVVSWGLALREKRRSV